MEGALATADTSFHPDYIDPEELDRVRRKQAARQRLEQLREGGSATPAPARQTIGLDLRDGSRPSAPTLRPVPLRGENPVLGAARGATALLVAFVERVMRPLGPGLLVLGFVMGLTGSLVVVGGVRVNRSATQAFQAREVLFETVERQSRLSDDLAALGHRDDTLRVLQLTLEGAKTPAERVERTRALLASAKVAHERLRLSTQPTSRMLLESVGARIDSLEDAVAGLERAELRWQRRADEGLGRLAVDLGVASRP